MNPTGFAARVAAIARHAVALLRTPPVTPKKKPDTVVGLVGFSRWPALVSGLQGF
ncbi:hypothetical protein [Pseudomonas sp. SCB32]|uniref:hypothetical protein n=1 Tax=Pseudomonas sp. SCB32 TaxID=2653853 RepID=UPI0015B70F2C|nr:hypothetical protein [Pseudomonas sp. SCB32]